jgi:transcriptional regulator with XRE-family HTH domain
MTFAENLQKERKNANISQECLAEQLHITRQAVSKWESGQSTPDVETCIQICRVLGVSPNRLLLGEKEEHLQEETKKSSIYTITTVFLMVVLLCGTIILVCNLNSNTFEPKVHTISIIMIGISVIAFSVTTVLKYCLKKKHTSN